MPAKLSSLGLVYVSDSMPGIRRIRRAKGFAYRDASGRAVRDPDELARIRKLAIPPAYTDVWICPLPEGHLQATGRDARGRKQYRYHASWGEHRTARKFERLQAFGLALPRIRARVARDLGKALDSSSSRTHVLAALVRLLDTTFIRVGNDQYARENGSYGLTTLRRRHATVRGPVVRLSFKGKGGVRQQAVVEDLRVARIVRRCQRLPRKELFQYLDEKGVARPLGSGDVNEYLMEAAGEHFTAKDFRTWHGTVHALELTRLACSGEDEEGYSVTRILAQVATRLGNTPAVCRKSYIHPAVLELGATLARGQDGSEVSSRLWKRLDKSRRRVRGLSAAERRLLRFLGDRRVKRR